MFVLYRIFVIRQTFIKYAICLSVMSFLLIVDTKFFISFSACLVTNSLVVVRSVWNHAPRNLTEFCSGFISMMSVPNLSFILEPFCNFLFVRILVLSLLIADLVNL